MIYPVMLPPKVWDGGFHVSRIEVGEISSAIKFVGIRVWPGFAVATFDTTLVPAELMAYVL